MKTFFRLLAVYAVLVGLTGAGKGFSWGSAASSLLTVAVLALLTRAVGACGWQLTGILFLLYGGTSYINTLIEAGFFSVLPWTESLRILPGGLLTALIVSVLIVFAMEGISPAWPSFRL